MTELLHKVILNSAYGRPCDACGQAVKPPFAILKGVSLLELTPNTYLCADCTAPLIKKVMQYQNELAAQQDIANPPDFESVLRDFPES